MLLSSLDQGSCRDRKEGEYFFDLEAFVTVVVDHFGFEGRGVGASFFCMRRKLLAAFFASPSLSSFGEVAVFV